MIELDTKTEMRATANWNFFEQSIQSIIITAAFKLGINLKTKKNIIFAMHIFMCYSYLEFLFRFL